MAGRVGQQFGSYRLVRLLGQGGFAEVYLGEHLQLGTHAAIKLLQTHIASEDVESFRGEARTIAHLVHPHIVRVFDFGVEGTIPFLVMDYATGGTVRKLYPRGVALPLPTIATYVTQTADALQYAHDAQVIHRDIKPENLLLGRHQEVLLGDFGIAQLAQSSRSQSTQDVAGTATYMAPEQFQGKPRPASDQYALGVMVYEWLCGDRPFHGSFTEVASQHLFVSPPPLREKVPAISAAIEYVVLTALAKDPKQRFASVQAFATAFVDASPSTLVAPARDLPSVAPDFTLAPTQIATQANQVPLPSHTKSPPSSLEPPALLTESAIPTELIPSSSPSVGPTEPTPRYETQPPMRPRGITYIAIFLCIAAVVSLILAFVSFAHSEYLEAGITALLAILLLIATQGLWTLKRWAFWAAAIVLTINALFILYLWFGLHGSLGTLLPVLLPNIIALIYLFARCAMLFSLPETLSSSR